MPQSSGQLITIKDVAKTAGVSLAAASSALHNTGRISEKRRAEVVAVAQRLGYQPRSAARMMRSRHTGHIGLIVNNVSPLIALERDPHRQRIASFINRCEQKNIPYHLDFCHVSHDNFIPPKHAAGGLVDGVLVLGDDLENTSEPNNHLKRWLRSTFKKPWVSLSSQSEFSVTDDIEEGVIHAITKFIELGHQKIGYVGFDSHFKPHQLGRFGFQRACEQLSFQTHQDWLLNPKLSGQNKVNDMRNVIEATEILLTHVNRPTALYCNGGEVGRAVLEAARRCSLSVPDQLCMICRCSIGMAEDAFPLLSSVEENVELVVDNAIEMLKRCIDKPKSTEQKIKIIPQIILRETTDQAKSSV